MRTNLPKLLDLLIFCIYSLNFSLEFFIMMFFVTNQLNISKFQRVYISKRRSVLKREGGRMLVFVICGFIKNVLPNY